MRGTRIRKLAGGALLGTALLLAAGGFGGCGSTKPPSLAPPTPPQWANTTLTFFHQPVPPSGTTTGWVTTVTVPLCLDSRGASVEPVVSVSNGTIALNGATYTWTRAVTGSPAVRVPGTFTADCIDNNGLHAHPVLSQTSA